MAKATVSTGVANKEVVQESIRKLPDLKIKDTKELPIENMSEHEADATAIGYTFIKAILPEIILR